MRARRSASSRATWLRSSPARKANGSSAVATNAAHAAASPAPAWPPSTSRNVSSAARVDRGELQPLERSAAPPAQGEPDEHDDEQDDVEQRLEPERDVREVGVAVDQQHVGRAVVAPELVRAGEQHRRHRATVKIT